MRRTEEDRSFVELLPSAMLRSTGECMIGMLPKKPDEPKKGVKSQFRRNSAGMNTGPSKESIGSLHRNLNALTVINIKERNDAMQARQELEKAKIDIEALKNELEIIHAQQRSRPATRENNAEKIRLKTASFSTPSNNHTQVAKEQHEELHWKLKLLENHCQDLAATNKQLIQEIQKNEAKVQQSSNELLQSKSSVDSLNIQIQALMNQLDDIKQQNLNLQHVQEASKKLAQDNEKLRYQVVQAHEELNAVGLKERKARQGLHDQINALINDKSAIMSQVATLNIALGDATEENASTLDKLRKLEGVHAILEAQVQTLMDTNLELTKANATLKDELDKELSSDIRGQRDELNHQCQHLTAVVAQLELDITKERRVSDDKQGMLEQYKTSIVHLTGQVESLVRQLAELEQQQPRNLNSLLDRLHPKTSNATVAALQLARSGQGEALSILSDEKDRLLAQVKALDEEKLQLRLELRAAEARFTAPLQSQIQELLLKQNEMLLTTDSLKAELAKARADNTSLRIAYDDLKKTPMMDPSMAKALEEAHKQLRSTVEKLVQAEASSETTFTCLQCLKPLHEPMTLIACGHTYCSICIKPSSSRDNGIKCQECGTQSDHTFHNKALADLAARFVFRQQTLAAIASTCQQLLA